MKEELARFIEQIGAFFERHGLSRTAGRLLGLVLVEDEPISLDQMAERLHVSKASISTNARLLERFGLVDRITLPGDRRDYYALVPDPWSPVTRISLRRAQQMIEVADRGLAALEGEPPETRVHVQELRDFYAFMANEMAAMLERWKQRDRDD